jgi:hypothetical protein
MKNISLYPKAKSRHIFGHPVPPEGRWPSSRTRDGSRWTRRLRLTSATEAYGEGVWSRRRGAGVNAPGGICLSGRNGGKRAVLRGEYVISRKAIAQGMSDVLRCPVCSCAHFLVHIAHEIAGAARIRHSLRPLTFEGGKFQQTSGDQRRENADLRSYARQRHCERSEAIHYAARRKYGLLRRFARNDVERTLASLNSPSPSRHSTQTAGARSRSRPRPSSRTVPTG